MNRSQVIEQFSRLVDMLIDNLVDKPTEVTQTTRYKSCSEELSVEIDFFNTGVHFWLTTGARDSKENDTFYLELVARNPIEGRNDFIQTFDFVKCGETVNFTILNNLLKGKIQEYANKIKDRLHLDPNED